MGFSDIASKIKDPKQLLQELGAVPSTYGDFDLDLIVREAPVYAWEITEYNSASGSTINDLRRELPVILTVDCVFTDKTYGVMDIASNVLNYGASGLLPETWRDKYRAFMDVARDSTGTPKPVTTGLDVYPDMVIESVSPVREAAKAGAFFVTVVFKHINLVSSETESTSLGLFKKEEKSDAMKKKTSKRKQKKTTPKQTEPEQETSLLYDMFGG